MFAAETYALILNWRDANGRQALNVAHIKNNTGSAMDSATAGDVIDAVKTAYDTIHGAATLKWQAYVANPAELHEVTVRGVDGDPFERTDLLDILGTGTDDQLSPQVALQMVLRTGGTGRKRRGRMFLPCISEAWNNSQGLPLAQLRTDLEIAISYLIGQLATLNTPLVVASQKGTPTNYIVTEATAWPEWRSQRRRAYR